MTPLDIAYAAHKDQKRHDGTPYISHPIAVSMMLTTLTEKAVAILHDVQEDTPFTAEDIENRLQGFDDTYNIHEILYVLHLLTHRPNEPYEEYIERVCTHPMAIKVKIADITHNISDDPTPRQRQKYYKGMIRLLQML
jgi:(p)ppGpp synthase/HD superfamily hydrolase